MAHNINEWTLLKKAIPSAYNLFKSTEKSGIQPSIYFYSQNINTLLTCYQPLQSDPIMPAFIWRLK